MDYLNRELNIKTYVDLRSYTELDEDEYVLSGNLLPNTAQIYDSHRQNIFSFYLSKFYLFYRRNLRQSKGFTSVLQPTATSTTSTVITSTATDETTAATMQRYTHFIPLASYPQIAYGVFSHMPFHIKVSKFILYN